MRERTPQFETMKPQLEKVNRQIIDLEKLIVETKKNAHKMELEHRAGTTADTDDLIIINQIHEEDKIKKQISILINQLQVLQEEKDKITSVLFKNQ